MALDELYQEIILDHYKHPRNRGEVDNADVVISSDNPFCGDRLRLTLKIDDGVITCARFEGQGCAISQASASLMSERIEGIAVPQALDLTEQVLRMIRGEGVADVLENDELSALKGVSAFPTRIKCASLAWNALKKALNPTNKKSRL